MSASSIPCLANKSETVVLFGVTNLADNIWSAKVAMVDAVSPETLSLYYLDPNLNKDTGFWGEHFGLCKISQELSGESKWFHDLVISRLET